MRASALTNRSLERTDCFYVMADEDSVRQQGCDAEENNFAGRSAHGSSDGRRVSWLQLLDAARSRARGLGMRTAGMCPLSTSDGRVMRRIFIDSRDLERLIERWKEVDNSEANLT